jgi:hypothetical protein
MKKLLVLIAIISFTGYLSAQEVVFEEVYDDTVIPKKGPNLKHYRHFYFDLGFPVMNESSAAEIVHGSSVSFDFGYRYKRKICEYWAVGYDFSYSFQSYKMKDTDIPSIETDSIEANKDYKKHHYGVHNLNLGVYQRINFNRRGNSIGKYLDIGGYGGWNFATNHIYKRKGDSSESFRVIEINEKGIEYIERFQYGIEARLGTNRYSVSARYRLSDLIDSDNEVLLGELPRLRVGIQIGFF